MKQGSPDPVAAAAGSPPRGAQEKLPEPARLSRQAEGLQSAQIAAGLDVSRSPED
jgi:hypothetical protein